MIYKPDWVVWLRSNMGEDGLPEVIKLIDRVASEGGWNRGYGPWYAAKSYFSHALRVSFAAPTHSYITVFRDCTLRILSDARDDSPRWAKEGDWAPVPLGGMNWFDTVVPLELAKAWSKDSEVDGSAVLEACERFFHSAKGVGWSRLWNHSCQYQYLTAVLFTLTFGGVDKARPMLALRKSFKATQEFRSWVEGLVTLWPAKGQTASAECLAHCDGLYEEVRDPNWRKDLPSTREEEAAGSFYPSEKTLFLLQLGLLRWHGLQKRPLAGNWANLIEEISA